MRRGGEEKDGGGVSVWGEGEKCMCRGVRGCEDLVRLLGLVGIKGDGGGVVGVGVNWFEFEGWGGSGEGEWLMG